MKNLTLLLLLCVSSMMLSQQQGTATSNGVFIPDAQVTELYKIVKQNDYLKKRTASAEKALDDAQKLVTEQKALNSKKDALIKLQNEELKKTTEMYGKEIDIKNLQITDLNNQLAESYTDAKKTGRNKFWNGFAVGGVSVAVIGTGTIIYLLRK